MNDISALGVFILPLIVFCFFFSNREFTYKVHYMMFTLALLKSLDLMFQAVSNSINCIKLLVSTRNKQWSLYGGQFTLSTQLMKPNYLVNVLLE